MNVECEIVPTETNAGTTVVVIISEDDGRVLIRLNRAWSLDGIGKALGTALTELLTESFIYVGDVREGL